MRRRRERQRLSTERAKMSAKRTLAFCLLAGLPSRQGKGGQRSRSLRFGHDMTPKACTKCAPAAEGGFVCRLCRQHACPRSGRKAGEAGCRGLDSLPAAPAALQQGDRDT